jgi:hypothetical protein
MESEISLKYAIILTRFDEFFKPNTGINFIYMSLGGYPNNIIPMVRELKGVTENSLPPFYFTEYKHDYFLPCLTNYIAILDIRDMYPILNYYYDLFDDKKKVEMVDYLKKNSESIFKDYRRCIDDEPIKIIEIKKWITRTEISKPKVYETEFNLFCLEEKQLDTVIATLLEKGIISEKNKINVYSFFENDFTKSVQFKTQKTIIVDLIHRMIFGKKYDKKKFLMKEAAYKLDCTIQFYNSKKKEYSSIKQQDLNKRGFSGAGLIPNDESKRLLLNIFPEVKIK